MVAPLAGLGLQPGSVIVSVHPDGSTNAGLNLMDDSFRYLLGQRPWLASHAGHSLEVGLGLSRIGTVSFGWLSWLPGSTCLSGLTRKGAAAADSRLAVSASPRAKQLAWCFRRAAVQTPPWQPP